MKRLNKHILQKLVKEVLEENSVCPKKSAPKQQYDARKYKLEEGEWENTDDHEWIRIKRDALLRLMALCDPSPSEVLK